MLAMVVLRIPSAQYRRASLNGSFSSEAERDRQHRRGATPPRRPARSSPPRLPSPLPSAPEATRRRPCRGYRPSCPGRSRRAPRRPLRHRGRRLPRRWQSSPPATATAPAGPVSNPTSAPTSAPPATPTTVPRVPPSPLSSRTRTFPSASFSTIAAFMTSATSSLNWPMSRAASNACFDCRTLRRPRFSPCHSSPRGLQGHDWLNYRVRSSSRCRAPAP